jgi:hypothetical protein
MSSIDIQFLASPYNQSFITPNDLLLIIDNFPKDNSVFASKAKPIAVNEVGQLVYMFINHDDLNQFGPKSIIRIGVTDPYIGLRRESDILGDLSFIKDKRLEGLIYEIRKSKLCETDFSLFSENNE